LGGGQRKKKKTLGGQMQIIKNNNGTFYKILFTTKIPAASASLVNGNITVQYRG
jgi:hypothetical protein